MDKTHGTEVEQTWRTVCSNVYAAKDILYALHKFSRAVYFEYEYANDAFSIGREQISLEKARACVKGTEMFTAHTRGSKENDSVNTWTKADRILQSTHVVPTYLLRRSWILEF